MDTCDKEHELCVLTTPSGFLPTRLVCTGLAGDRIRIVRNVDLAPGAKFCTLSHCWGGYMPLKLQHDNFARLSQDIPHEELSNTFKDALHIARRLGMSYIWIDSLCIIQDDPQDWTRESSLMAQIYETSALNIAATRS
ncbi:HET-domain-containing protein, partial [Corynespora cassiicola Philippines]